MNDKQMKKAAALKYDQAKNMAPRVVARGKGHIAEQISGGPGKRRTPS
jgi:flagellar biosynthesis protein